MKWIRITDKSKKLPMEPYMCTDGTRIAIYHCGPNRRCFDDGSMFLSEATHYILLKDLPLPKGPNEVD